MLRNKTNVFFFSSSLSCTAVFYANSGFPHFKENRKFKSITDLIRDKRINKSKITINKPFRDVSLIVRNYVYAKLNVYDYNTCFRRFDDGTDCTEFRIKFFIFISLIFSHILCFLTHLPSQSNR